ncbi:MAG: beta-galactosidase [Bacteroidales bacterium]|nr:beta-galactosidase [Bacteroidales bacterium]
MKIVRYLVIPALALTLMQCKEVPVNPELAQTETGSKLIGVVAPKTLDQVHNDLTIGCEVLDRDYADYHKYKEDLAQLGIRKIRLQAGWAKTEKEKGVYDFAWLDSIIDDAVSRGLEPWLETSYGNPIYEGGGTPFLSGGWPTSEEALQAWDNWVRAMAERYKGKVHEWEIWNEPDGNRTFYQDPTPLAELQVRTAAIIKDVDPDARIAGFAWAGWHPKEFNKCMEVIRDAGKLDLFEWISYHFYHFRPEDMYVKVDAMQDSLNRFSTKIILRQGETGAPSKGYMGGALSKYDWSEISQGKWALRRMLSDRGRNIPTTIFCISDMNYKGTDAIKMKNVKGLLESDDDNNIVRRKQAYYAVQNLVAVWDILKETVPADGMTVEGEGSYSKYLYTDPEGRNAFVIWEDSSAPVDDVKTLPTKVTVTGGQFKKPVCVDIRTGNVYKIAYEKNGPDWTFTVPVYDCPMLVVDKGMITLK